MTSEAEKGRELLRDFSNADRYAPEVAEAFHRINEDPQSGVEVRAFLAHVERVEKEHAEQIALLQERFEKTRNGQLARIQAERADAAEAKVAALIEAARAYRGIALAFYGFRDDMEIEVVKVDATLAAAGVVL